jgi:hypothetical protein
MARYYSGENQPLGTWNNIPIYLTTIFTALLVVGFIGTAILQSAGSMLEELFIFGMPLYPAWTVWRVFTYVFINPLNFFTPFGIWCFYWFAVGIETHLGRVRLSQLVALLTLVPVVFIACLWWGFGIPSGVGRMDLLLAGLLVAFATLYPNTEALGWIPFKWMAFACIFCGSLMYFAHREWMPLIELWLSCVAGFAFIRLSKEQEYDDYVSPFSRLKTYFRRKPKLRVMPSPQQAAVRRSPVVDEPPSELDVLLDKIAKSGMGSLTPKERAQLEKAREALMRKDKR